MRVLGDSAYGTGEARAALADAGHVAVIKPNPLRAAVPGGFTIDDFIVDLDARTVTCPASSPAAHPAQRRGRLRSTLPLHARWRHGAPPPSADGNSPSHEHERAAAGRPQPSPRSRTGRPSIVSTGRWSNARSPGSPEATAKSATAASPRTTTGCTTGRRTEPAPTDHPGPARKSPAPRTGPGFSRVMQGAWT